jgi:hypothetical protein
MSSAQDTDTHEADFKRQVESMAYLIDAPPAADVETDDSELKARLENLRNELTQHADKLAHATDWSRDRFLEHAGCSSAQMVIEGRAKIDFMLACLSYLMWMEDFLAQLDLVLDRQTAVIASARLFSEGGRDLNDCKRAMEEKLDPAERSAKELISWGEVTKGFQVALAHTESKAGKEIKRVLLDDPSYLSSPHVTDDRVDLAWIEPEALGVNVAKRIRNHVGRCTACDSSRTDTPS